MVTSSRRNFCFYLFHLRNLNLVQASVIHRSIRGPNDSHWKHGSCKITTRLVKLSQILVYRFLAQTWTAPTNTKLLQYTILTIEAIHVSICIRWNPNHIPQGSKMNLNDERMSRGNRRSSHDYWQAVWLTRFDIPMHVAWYIKIRYCRDKYKHFNQRWLRWEGARLIFIKVSSYLSKRWEFLNFMKQSMTRVKSGPKLKENMREVE